MNTEKEFQDSCDKITGSVAAMVHLLLEEGHDPSDISGVLAYNLIDIFMKKTFKNTSNHGTAVTRRALLVQLFFEMLGKYIEEEYPDAISCIERDMNSRLKEVLKNKP